jgi:DNA polymerase-3 subunit gamma/tau
VTYEPLHHKYRPQTFAELVGQQAIATTLTNALRQRRIAPAYLFTGARGTGKTSSARIFAKSLNCIHSSVPTEQPCGVCEVCVAIARGSSLDIIEIDAASNTGVDNIRELIERAQFAPVQCRYKVYVIDEVHMLSTAAFNALLKTLEEPPDRVVFVLATTDPQKVLPTIISRCQRFDFRRIPLEDMVTHLSAIAAKESISIAPDAVQLVAQISQGGLRDAESLLDQLSLLEGEITVERVWDLVGAVPERDLMDLLWAIAQDNPSTVLDKSRNLMDRGREPLIVLQNLASFYRDLLIAKTAPDRNDLVAITPPTWAALCEFAQTVSIGWITAGQQHLRSSEVQVKNTSQPRLWLEVTLLGLLPSAVSQQPKGVAPSQPAQPASSNGQPQPSPTTNLPVAPTKSQPPPQPQPAEPPPPPASAPEVASKLDARQDETTSTPENVHDLTEKSAQAERSPDAQQLWHDILKRVQPFSTRVMLQQQCHLIAFNGREARIGAKSEKLFKMAKDRLPNIEAAFETHFNQKVRVSLEVATTFETPAQPSVDAQPHERPSSKPSHSPQKQPPAPTVTTEPPPAKSDRPFPSAKESSLPSAATPSPPKPTEETAQPDPQTYWQDEDDVLKAAKSLAQMFNGQIVNLDDHEEPELGQSSGELGSNLSETDAETGEEDDDVPF